MVVISILSKICSGHNVYLIKRMGNGKKKEKEKDEFQNITTTEKAFYDM